MNLIQNDVGTQSTTEDTFKYIAPPSVSISSKLSLQQVKPIKLVQRKGYLGRKKLLDRMNKLNKKSPKKFETDNIETDSNHDRTTYQVDGKIVILQIK